MGQVGLIYIIWIINRIFQIWYTWCHAMASWQMCWHRANTFVLVFRIVNTSGCAGFASTTGMLWLSFGWLLVWVVFLPLLNWNPWLKTTQVLSGAYHVHAHISIYLCIWCTTAAVWLCSYTAVPISLLGALQFMWTTHERQWNGRRGLCGTWKALGTSWVSSVVVASSKERALSFLLIDSEQNGWVVSSCHPWVWMQWQTRFWGRRSLCSTWEVLGTTCNIFTLLSRFSLIAIELEPDVLINGVLNDSCDGLW